MKDLIKKLIYIIKDLRATLNFEKNYASFKGVYKTFDEANKTVTNKIIGYNNNESANDYLDKFSLKKISEFEYPLFFWLNRILNEKKQNELTIFDFGGNLGGHYFKFKENSINNNFKWLVCEVEALTKIGNEKFKNIQLDFTSDFNEVKKSGIFFSSGAIQYAESLSLSLSLSLGCRKNQSMYYLQGCQCKIM